VSMAHERSTPPRTAYASPTPLALATPFTVPVAAALAWGWPIERALRLGSAVGGLACRGLGGQSSLPTLTEAETLAHEQDVGARA
jgi:hypothetical protein